MSLRHRGEIDRIFTAKSQPRSFIIILFTCPEIGTYSEQIVISRDGDFDRTAQRVLAFDLLKIRLTGIGA